MSASVFRVIFYYVKGLSLFNYLHGFMIMLNYIYFILRSTRFLGELNGKPTIHTSDAKLMLKAPQRKSVRELEEERRIIASKEMEEIRAKERKDIIENCKRQIFYERDHAKTLNRALLFSEVLREREAQVKFNKYLRELEAKREARWADKVKQNALEHERDKLEEKNKHIEKMLKFKSILQQQLQEQAELQGREAGEVLRAEKQELEDIRHEVAEADARRTADDRARKLAFRREVERNLREAREHQERMERAELLQDQLDYMHRQFQDHLKRTRLGKEREIRENLEKRAEDMAAKVAAFVGDQRGKEEESIRKAIEEKETELAERERRGRAHQEALREERRRAHRDHLVREDCRRQEEQQQLHLDMLQRLKQAEVDRQEREEKSAEGSRLRAELLRSHREQQALRREAERQEREGDAEATRRAAEAWRADDLRFLRYAGQVLEESRLAGRPLLPLSRAVEPYRRKYGEEHPA
ncbi:trichohyalin-like isoform X2 [Bacillus rossius redtenbacheri]|uniref:trichohyalin-like isoform X2 n=1 Tax=Bacillus rossius redtenbacheri TaxID=93214 RepID=UPI002FDDF390